MALIFYNRIARLVGMTMYLFTTFDKLFTI